MLLLEVFQVDSCQLKSVESYDYYENKWTYLPDMNEKRMSNALIGIGNKLFVIGGRRISSCEVFDSCSRKFTFINSDIKVSSLETNYFRAFCIGSNIVVFHNSWSLKSMIYVYESINLSGRLLIVHIIRTILCQVA